MALAAPIVNAESEGRTGNGFASILPSVDVASTVPVVDESAAPVVDEPQPPSFGGEEGDVVGTHSADSFSSIAVEALLRNSDANRISQDQTNNTYTTELTRALSLTISIFAKNLLDFG
jgi:hypothetical protein